MRATLTGEGVNLSGDQILSRVADDHGCVATADVRQSLSLLVVDFVGGSAPGSALRSERGGGSILSTDHKSLLDRSISL